MGAGVIAIISLIVVLVVFFGILNIFVPVGLWITALFSGVKVGLGDLIGMRLRRVVPREIVIPMIKATKAGVCISCNI